MVLTRGVVSYVSRPASYYHMLVFFCAKWPAKFVVCVGQYSEFGTFLVEWTGKGNEYEKECCGICIFGPTYEDIKYRLEVWDNQLTDVTPKRISRTGDSLGQPTTPQEQQKKSEAQSTKSPYPSALPESW